MKEPLADRFDVLLSKARSGDTNAQLELARCFYHGKLVEKSIDQAKYWAFKAILGGNRNAFDLYRTLT